MKNKESLTLLELLIIIAIIVGLSFLLVPKQLDKGDFSSRRARCLSNLKQISLAFHMYTIDYNGSFPENLSQLYPQYISDLEIFICPDRIPLVTEEDISKNFNICYEYVPGMTEEYDSNCVIVYDREENHEGEGRNVLYVSGHIRWISKEAWISTWQTHLEKFEASKEKVKQKHF